RSGEPTAIQGTILIDTSGTGGAGSPARDTLNVSDFGSGAGRTYSLTFPAGGGTQLSATGVANIVYDRFGGPGQLEFFHLTGSDTGTNTYNINNTTASIQTTISDGDQTAGAGSNGTFNIVGDGLSAANIFQGFDGNDQFVI